MDRTEDKVVNVSQKMDVRKRTTVNEEKRQDGKLERQGVLLSTDKYGDEVARASSSVLQSDVKVIKEDEMNRVSSLSAKSCNVHSLSYSATPFKLSTVYPPGCSLLPTPLFDLPY